MNVADRLRQAVEGVPDEGAIQLPAAAVRRWLEEGGEPSDNGLQRGTGEVADLSVSDIAEAHDKAESTVREWLQDVDGVYRLGNELRVSREDWRAHLDSLADAEAKESEPATVRSSAGADLSSWRDER